MTAAVPKCLHCHDTGSLSKDIEGQLDCGHCEVAQRRTGLNAWCHRTIPKGCSQAAAAWLIFQCGYEVGALETLDDE